jgi:hypothetical protein
MKRVSLLIGPLLIIIVAITFAFTTRSNDKLEPVHVQAKTPIFNNLKELVDASDAVVIARVTTSQTGRVISSPTNAATGIRTQLLTLEIGDVLDGQATSEIILEQEYELADGRPVIVNEMPPTKELTEGVFFLIRGKSDAFPHHALISQQGRYLASGANRDQLTPAATDPLSLSLAALGPYELRCQILEAGDTGKRC